MTLAELSCAMIGESEHEVVDRLIQEYKIKTVVEIGSFLGFSALFFAKRVEHLTCIDPFRVEHSDPWAQHLVSAGVPLDFFALFIQNIAESGLQEKIEILRGKSSDMAWAVPDVDLVYIDGEHSYENCKRDIELYLPKAKKLLVGDDHHSNDKGTPHFPGVVRACKEMLPGYKHEGRIWWYVI